VQARPRPDGRGRRLLPTPARDIDKPFNMAVEDVFSITGRGTVATGRVEAGTIHNRRRGRDSGHDRGDPQDGLHRRRDVPQDTRRGPGRRQHRHPAPRSGPGRDRARAGHSKARFHHAAHQVPRPGVRPLKGRGRTTHPVLHGLSSPVYFRTTDVTGTIALAEGVEMVMPGDKHGDGRGAHHTDSHGTKDSALPSARVAGPSAPAGSSKDRTVGKMRVKCHNGLHRVQAPGITQQKRARPTIRTGSR